MDSFIRDLIAGQNFAQTPLSATALFLLVTWSLFCKGIALWRCANLKQKNWFVAILIVNTAGILEIAYLFYFSQSKLNIQEIFGQVLSLKSKRPR